MTITTNKKRTTYAHDLKVEDILCCFNFYPVHVDEKKIDSQVKKGSIVGYLTFGFVTCVTLYISIKYSTFAADLFQNNNDYVEQILYKTILHFISNLLVCSVWVGMICYGLNHVSRDSKLILVCLAFVLLFLTLKFVKYCQARCIN